MGSNTKRQIIQGKKWNLDKWFVPSKSEWVAVLGDMTYTKMGVTTGNYSNYGLKANYWSSAQDSMNSAYYANFSNGFIDSTYVNNRKSVRLSATF